MERFLGAFFRKLSGKTQAEATGSVLLPAGQNIDTGWISAVSGEDLRRQELTWVYSDKNANSPAGKVNIPLIRAELARRGVAGYNLTGDDENLNQIVNITKGKAE
jgi:hypothetical protein